MAEQQAQNPFVVGSPVTDSEMFFGREKEMQEILVNLRKGDSVHIVGSRRSGKTSLLNQLRERQSEIGNRVVLIVVDAIYDAPDALLHAILQKLTSLLGNEATPISGFDDFRGQVEQMASEGYRLVICLDEFEHILERPDFDDHFFASLRSLAQSKSMTYVIASLPSAQDLLPRTSGSPFFNIFVRLHLPDHLGAAAARALLVEPLRRNNVSVPAQEVIDEIVKMTDAHPYLLQTAGSNLFEWQKADQPTDLGTLQERIRKARANIEPQDAGTLHGRPAETLPDDDDPLLLTYRLVHTRRAPPNLLITLDADETLKALYMVSPDASGPELLLQAQKILAEESHNAKPNPLWLAWVRATEAERIERLQKKLKP